MLDAACAWLAVYTVEDIVHSTPRLISLIGCSACIMGPIAARPSRVVRPLGLLHVRSGNIYTCFAIYGGRISTSKQGQLLHHTIAFNFQIGLFPAMLWLSGSLSHFSFPRLPELYDNIATRGHTNFALICRRNCYFAVLRVGFD